MPVPFPLLMWCVLAGCFALVGAQGCRRSDHVPAPEAASGVVVAQPPPAPVDATLARRAEAGRLFSKKDYDGALAALDAAVRDLAKDDARLADIRCEQASVLASRGAAIVDKDLRAAERDLRAAIDGCPSVAHGRQNLAVILYRVAKDTDPVAHGAKRKTLVEESLKLQESPAALAEMALILEAENDARGALIHIERACALLPDDADLRARRDRLKKAAAIEGGFKDARHSHFVARFEGPAEERIAWQALDVLEKAYFLVGDPLNLHPDKPVTVVIYTNGGFEKAVASPEWAAGVFDGKIRIRAADLALAQGRIEDTLVHEYVHAALHTGVRGELPSWFHEGLAQHFEDNREVNREGNRERNLEGNRADPARALAGGWPSLPTLNAPFSGLSGPDATRAYAGALALVTEMIRRRGIYGVQQLLAEMNRGRSFDEAMVSTYAFDAARLHGELSRR